MARQTFKTAQEIAADIARDFREDASRWTQRAWSRDANGVGTYEHSEDAVCWCLRGAIDIRLDPDAAAGPILSAFDRALGYEPEDDDDTLRFVAWNDAPGRTVGEVIALCDKVAQS